MSQGELADYVYLSTYLGSEGWISTAQAINRPGDTNAYAGAGATTLGDLIANSTTAGSVSPFAFDIPAIDTAGVLAKGEIAFVKVEMAGKTSKTVRVHFYKGTNAQVPTVSAGDNSELAVSNHNVDRYLGYADIALQPGPGGSDGFTDLVRLPYELVKSGSSTNEKVFALIEGLTAFTPVSAGAISVTIGARRRK